MKRTSASIILASALAAPAGATPWHNLGPRAMGMGGAQVAIAQGPLASYWNPAGLGQLYNTSGFESGGGIRVEFTGTVLQGAKDLNELQKACAAGTASCSVANVTDALNRLNNKGNGILSDVGVPVDVKIKRAVLFVNTLSYVGGTPRMDPSLAGCPGVACLSAANNKSKIVVRGGVFHEIGIGYGHEIMETGLRRLTPLSAREMMSL